MSDVYPSNPIQTVTTYINIPTPPPTLIKVMERSLLYKYRTCDLQLPTFQLQPSNSTHPMLNLF